MKKIIKNIYKDLLINIFFVLVYIIIYLIITKNGKYIFASTLDFDVQHYIIPEYLREIFYNTKNIIPNFSFNLASGTNIYNLAYYGILNPIILISFLFPKIKMLDYVLISMSVVVLSSTSLMYFYLRKNKYSYKVSFICAFLYLCSSPLILHSHRHIMFVDYMPFLLMGFFGIDRYLEKKKSLLLMISILLMILTSYFFSISGLVVLTLLGMYKYLKAKKTSIKELFSFTFKLVLRYIPPILTSSILLLPTAISLLNGRSTNQGTSFLKDLLLPKNYLLYDTYSIGLTLISLISIIYFIFKGKKENRFLSIIILICSIIPLPALILNGFLYVNGKSLIPFMPLVIILIAEFLYIIFQKTKYNYLLIIYLIITSLSICIYVNQKDVLIEKNAKYLKEENIYRNKINKIINNDDIYRIKTNTLGKQYINKITNIHEYKTTSYLSSNNQKYNNLYKYTFENPLQYRNSMILSSSDNIIFEMYMGEKYKFTTNTYKNIYKKIDSYNDINIYRNDIVLPLGYATDKYINKEDFKQLSYPNNMINLLGNAINNKETNTNIKTVKEIPNNYRVVDSKNVTYKEIDDGYEIKSKNNGTITLTTDEYLNNKLLFISFELSDRNNCMYHDLSISINNIENLLTCKNWKYYNNNKKFNYVITENQNYLTINFIKGNYKIHNIKLYTLDYEEIMNINKDITPMIIDKDKSNSDILTGKINVSKDSYFTASIPYDENIVVKVDNKMIEYEETNTAFIGFDIKKGNHTIEITYQPKGKEIGKYLSILGLLLIIITVICENRKIHEN